MNEFRTLPELQYELVKLKQALENEDITTAAFRAGAADLKRQIKVLKLERARQEKTDELGALKISGKISGLVYARLIIKILNAKTMSDLNRI